MSGPMPKNPAVRQRRNKSSSRAILPAEPIALNHRPKLPALPGKKEWHPFARRYWRLIWASPMAHEFAEADEPALLRLVMLVNRFYNRGSLEVAKEIRMLEREFGLTPLSRRRLEWTIAQTEEAQDQHEEKRIRRATVIDGNAVDPRGVLDG